MRPFARFLLTAAVVLLPTTPPLVRAQALGELVIIANPDVPVASLASEELARMYLGKVSRWQNGTTVVPVMLKTGPVQEEFVEDYLSRPVHRFVTYWRQMVFTGKGVPPRSFTDQAALVEFVATTPGAVGYAPPGTDTGSLKVLKVD